MKKRPHTLIIILFVSCSFMIWLNSAGGRDKEGINYLLCMECHRGIQKISQSHDQNCIECHILPDMRQRGHLKDHSQIVSNPSSPENWGTFCMPCHKKEIETLKKSLHYTMAGIINQTRYLWGAQRSAYPPIYGIGTLRPPPKPTEENYPDNPSTLVDDFLRKRCLRCHISTKGPGGYGLHRSTGCASCHVVYDNDGLYRGNDVAIDKTKPGRPVIHSFTRNIPVSQCLHCHNVNNVGTDYVGMFEHDYSYMFRSPNFDGKPQRFIYGMDYHYLSKDVHMEKGLLCIDCHTKEDVMGDDRIYGYQLQVPKRKCTDCHGGYDRGLKNSKIKEISKGAEGYLFTSRAGKKLPIRVFSRDIIPHSIENHRKLRCSACHSQWSYQDYGMSVIREDAPDPYKWYYLSTQSDPYVEKILRNYYRNPEKTELAGKDWIAEELSPGIWFSGWRFRRWEIMPLGIDQNGRYSIIRPRYQFLISYVDKLGNVVLDSVRPMRGDGKGKGWAFMPYVPHTISPSGAMCERCHKNRLNLGLGLSDGSTMDTSLMKPSRPAIHAMRLLNSREKKMLLNPSLKWKQVRLKYLLNKYDSLLNQ